MPMGKYEAADAGHDFGCAYLREVQAGDRPDGY